MYQPIVMQVSVITVTFDYTATDSSGAENAISESKTVTLEITGTNDQPIVENIAANENGDDIVEVVGLNALDNTLYSGYYLSTVQQTFIATEDSLSNIELEVYAIGYSNGYYDGTFQVQVLDAQGNEISLSSPINSGDTEITGNTHGVPSGIISIDLDASLDIESTYTINFIVLSGNPLIVSRVAENSSDGLGIVYNNNSLQDYSDLAIKLTYETGGLVVFETGNETNTTFVETLDTVSDLDTTDTHTYQVVADSVEINGVSASNDLVSIDYIDDGEGSGHWEYKVEGDFNYLSEGEIARVTFDYTATDDSGTSNAVSEAKTITLNITGTNDQPIVEDINANILPVAV